MMESRAPAIEAVPESIVKDEGPPDWDAVTETIACPLCSYNLRGLVEARCPECGYAFTWLEILDPGRRKHPYLFEHHPEANVWSFRATFAGGINPMLFWSELRPSQPSNAKRLLIYWFIFTLLAGWMLVVPIVKRGIELDEWYRVQQQTARNSGSLANVQVAERTFPVLPNPRFIGRLAQTRGAGGCLSALLILFAFPWLSFSALLIFQISMLKAKVNNVHVLRCALYNYDAVAWLGGIQMGLALIMLLSEEAVAKVFEADRILMIFVPGFFVVMLIYWIRLAVAYRRYIQFDHPGASVLCAAVVATLATLVVMNLNAITGGWVPIGF